MPLQPVSANATGTTTGREQAQFGLMVANYMGRTRDGNHDFWAANRAKGWLSAAAEGRKIAGRTMKRTQLLDLYFLEARAKLIDVAAFMDRVDRGEGEADFRYDAFK